MSAATQPSFMHGIVTQKDCSCARQPRQSTPWLQCTDLKQSEIWYSERCKTSLQVCVVC